MKLQQKKSQYYLSRCIQQLETACVRDDGLKNQKRRHLTRNDSKQKKKSLKRSSPRGPNGASKVARTIYSSSMAKERLWVYSKSLTNGWRKKGRISVKRYFWRFPLNSLIRPKFLRVPLWHLGGSFVQQRTVHSTHSQVSKHMCLCSIFSIRRLFTTGTTSPLLPPTAPPPDSTKIGSAGDKQKQLIYR